MMITKTSENIKTQSFGKLRSSNTLRRKSRLLESYYRSERGWSESEITPHDGENEDDAVLDFVVPWQMDSNLK
jgi:hypothetical protein